MKSIYIFDQYNYTNINTNMPAATVANIQKWAENYINQPDENTAFKEETSKN